MRWCELAWRVDIIGCGLFCDLVLVEASYWRELTMAAFSFWFKLGKERNNELQRLCLLLEYFHICLSSKLLQLVSVTKGLFFTAFTVFTAFTAFTVFHCFHCFLCFHCFGRIWKLTVLYCLLTDSPPSPTKHSKLIGKQRKQWVASGSLRQSPKSGRPVTTRKIMIMLMIYNDLWLFAHSRGVTLVTKG